MLSLPETALHAWRRCSYGHRALRSHRNDVHPDLPAADAPRDRAVAGRPSPRTARPGHDEQVLQRSRPRQTAPRPCGPAALDLAVALVARLANGARHHQARDRPRVAPPVFSMVLDVEESPARGSTDHQHPSPRADSRHGARESALGSATHSRRTVGIGTGGLSGDGGQIHASAAHRAVANLAHVPRESRPPKSQPPISSSCRPPPGACCLCWCSSPTSAAATCTSPSPTIRRPPGQPDHCEKPSRGTAPARYLIHDRDTAFAAWATTASAIGIEEVITAAHSRWQNAYAERLIKVHPPRVSARAVAYWRVALAHVQAIAPPPHRIPS